MAICPLLCCGLTPPIPGKVVRPMVEVKQGMGAKALIAPRLIIVSPPVVRIYWAVTATNTSGESGFSNEVVVTNKSAKVRTVALACNSQTNTTGYKFYRGNATSSYTRAFLSSTNQVTLPLFGPDPTNFVLTVSGASNLSWSTDLAHWNSLGATNYASTNGPSRPFWRGYGLTIKAGWVP